MCDAFCDIATLKIKKHFSPGVKISIIALFRTKPATRRLYAC